VLLGKSNLLSKVFFVLRVIIQAMPVIYLGD